MLHHPADTFGRGYLESRVATHDGYIWPITRDKMVSAGAIRERMIEDIAALVFDGGAEAQVTLGDLAGKGWTLAQVDAHGAHAFAVFNAEYAPLRTRRITGNRSTVRRLAPAAPAALALLLYAAAIGLVAGNWAGVL